MASEEAERRAFNSWVAHVFPNCEISNDTKAAFWLGWQARAMPYWIKSVAGHSRKTKGPPRGASDEDIQTMRNMRAAGWSVVDIAKQMGYDWPKTVYRYVKDVPSPVEHRGRPKN